MKYITLLRGINVSGKNKIAMSDLKAEFEKLGFCDVSTYLNSGNVLFATDSADQNVHRMNIEEMIKRVFGFDIPVYVIEASSVEDILANAPEWWGTEDKDTYDNLIFILSDDTPEEITNLIGPVSEGLESVEIYKNIIFWTFDRKAYQKCNWWKKTATTGIAEKLTIRTANTVKKLCK